MALKVLAALNERVAAEKAAQDAMASEFVAAVKTVDKAAIWLANAMKGGNIDRTEVLAAEYIMFRNAKREAIEEENAERKELDKIEVEFRFFGIKKPDFIPSVTMGDEAKVLADAREASESIEGIFTALQDAKHLGVQLSEDEKNEISKQVLVPLHRYLKMLQTSINSWGAKANRSDRMLNGEYWKLRNHGFFDKADKAAFPALFGYHQDRLDRKAKAEELAAEAIKNKAAKKMQSALKKQEAQRIQAVRAKQSHKEHNPIMGKGDKLEGDYVEKMAVGMDVLSLVKFNSDQKTINLGLTCKQAKAAGVSIH